MADVQSSLSEADFRVRLPGDGALHVGEYSMLLAC